MKRLVSTSICVAGTVAPFESEDVEVNLVTVQLLLSGRAGRLAPGSLCCKAASQ